MDGAGSSLQSLSEGLWIADGEPIRFLSFPYALRMTLVRLADGSLFVHSPVQLSEERKAAVDALGPVRHLVTPNKLHHLFLEPWSRAYPDAKLHAPPGLETKREDLAFSDVLSDEPDPAWADRLDQVVVRGSVFMEEVVFFHRPSATLILGDLIENHDPARFSPLQRWVARRDRMFGDTPINYRLSFLRRKAARAAMEKVLAWEPERVVVMHGACIEEDAGAYLRRAFAWLLGRPRF